MRSLKYAVVFEKGKRSYGAYVPDLPGCVAVAKTLDETKQLIREAVAFHLEGMRADGLPIPEPSTVVSSVSVRSAQPSVKRVRRPSRAADR